MKSNIRTATYRNSLFLVSAVFALSIVALPLSVSAQSTKTKVGKTMLGSTDQECMQRVANVSESNLNALKAYGDRRFEKRKSLLNKYVTRVEERYKSVERNREIKRKNTAKIAASKKLTTYEAASNGTQISKDPLISEVKSTIGQVDNLKGRFNNAKTVGQAADPLCSLVYDQKVFSYLGNKITQQRRIDNLKISFNENNVRLANYKKAEQKGANNKQVLAQIDTVLAKNNEYIAQVNKIQEALTSIKKDTLPAVNQQGHAIKSADHFNTIWGPQGKTSYKALVNDSKAQTKAVTAIGPKVKTKKPKN